MQSGTIENKFGRSQEAPTTIGGPQVELDIEKELDGLHRSPEWQHGMARKVLIRYPDFQITCER